MTHTCPQGVTPREAKALHANPEVRVLDVRSQGEFEAGHIEGAYNIPILFHAPRGSGPNHDFVDAVKRHFALGEPLLLV